MVILETVIVEGEHEGRTVRGWDTLKRWSDPPVILSRTAYYTENGFKKSEVQRVDDLYRVTWWNFDGSVDSQTLSLAFVPFATLDGHSVMALLAIPFTPYGQVEVGNSVARTIYSPPWLWGVTDQTEPTAPWWNKE